MALNLQEQITADAQSGGVFFQGSGKGFDEDVIHYPAGDLSAPVTVRAVIDFDAEDSGGIGEGEGPRFDSPQGVRLRRNGILSLPIAVTVTEQSGKAQRSASLFEFYGYRWRTVRIIARDASLQDVSVTRVDKRARRRVARP